MKWLFSMMLVLASAALVVANYNGFTNGDGYTYHDGYWYWGEQAYTRTLIQPSGYWSYGCYHPGRAYYQYSAYTAPVVTYKTPEWRTRLLELATARDRREGLIRQNAFEHQYFLEAIKTLGLEGNFRWNGYGMTPPGYSGDIYRQQTTSYGANASTIYGYSYNTIASLYGDTNLNQLYLQAAQLAEGSQNLTREAVAGHQNLVGLEGSNRARVAEILAKAQMASQIISSLQATPTIETKGFSFKVVPGGGIEKVEEGVDAKTKEGLVEQFAVVARESCASCHSGKKLEGKFDITNYLNMSPREKEKVWQRLTDPDPKRRMPKDADPLPPEKLRLFFLN